MPQLIPGSGADKFFRTLGKVKERYNANLDQSPGAFNQPGAGGLIGRPLDSAPAPSAANAAPPSVPSPPSADFSGVRGGSATAPKRILDGGITATVDANGTPVYRGNMAPSARPAVTQPAPVTAVGSQAPQVQATTQRTLEQLRGNTMGARADAAGVLNPLSADAELMRRFEISQGYGSNKGSPQARRLAGEAILGQLGARNAASATGQKAANEGALAGATAANVAGESAAQRTLDAAQGNQRSDQLTAQRLAEQAQPSQLVRGLDGNTNVLRNDGTTATLRDEAGRPIQTPAPATAGAITPQDLLKAQTEEIKAVQQNLSLTDEQRAAAISGIQSRYAAMGGGSQRGPAPPQVGSVVKGYRFKGGDPAEQSNWEKVN